MNKHPGHAVTTQLKFLLDQMIRDAGAWKLVQGIGFNDSVMLTLHASPECYGIVNGKGGRTLDALKFICETAGRKTGCDCRLKLNGRYNDDVPPPIPFVQDPEVDIDQLITIIKALVAFVIDQPAADTLTHARDNDLLDVKVEINRNNPWQTGGLTALDAVVHAIGMARGINVKLRKHRQEAAKETA